MKLLVSKILIIGIMLGCVFTSMTTVHADPDIAAPTASLENAQDFDSISHTLITQYVAKIVLVGTGFAVLMLVWNIVLRRQVAKSTAELRVALRQAQDAANSNKLFSALIDAVPDIAWVKDRQGRFLAVNKALYLSNNLTSADDMLGKTDHDFSPHEWAAHYQADDDDVMRSGHTKIIEEQLVLGGDALSSHEPRWIESIKAPWHNDAGEIVGTVGIARDITALKTSESSFKHVSDQLTNIINNLPGNILRITIHPTGPGAIQLVGGSALRSLAPQGPISPEGILEMIHPDDRHLYARVMTEELYKTGFSEQRLRITPPDGEMTWQLLRCKVNERIGDDLIVDGISLDITLETLSSQALEQEEAELRRMELNLARASKMAALGSLAGGVAHNFNNLLGAIQGYAEFICEDNPATSVTHRHAERVVLATRRGKNLIDQILAFARERELQMEQVKLDDAQHKVAEKLLSVHVNPAFEVVRSIQTDNPVVLGDRERLEQILTSLCLNAADSLNGKSGTITVGVADTDLDHDAYQKLLTRPQPDVAAALEVWNDSTGLAWAIAGHMEPGTEYISMIVADTGCGMDAAIIEQVFTPFYSKRTKSLSLGLGLAIVHGMVLAHKGALVVKTRPDHGTQIEICLPKYAD